MSLASVPTELIEAIVTHLDVDTFCSLRLVSSSLKHRSLHVFRDRFFRKRHIAWTKSDLDGVSEIAAHSYFGNAIQQLYIDATPNQSIRLWQLRKRISEADAVFSEPSGVVFKSDLQEQYIAEEKVAQDLANFFTETRHDQKCLRAVFARIQYLEKVEFSYKGMQRKYGKFARKYCEFSQHEMSRPVLSTLSAIAASGIQVKDLSISPSMNYGAVSIGRLESLAPSLTRFDGAFEKLEKLALHLRDWRSPESGFELESTRVPFIVRFLAKARNVKYLYLSCHSSLDVDLMGDVARHCSFSKLEECALTHVRFENASDLYAFLAPSNSTLRILQLGHVVLRDPTVAWVDFFRRLASSKELMPAMELMMLEKLFTRTGLRLMFGSFKERVVVAGDGSSSWREVLLSCLDDFMEITLGPAWQLSVVAYPFIDLRT